MERQQETYPDKDVPILLPCLAEAILKLDGVKTEGIFRVPGDAGQVSGDFNN
jgi:hypothetical protein